jgi:hypothetical protein
MTPTIPSLLPPTLRPPEGGWALAARQSASRVGRASTESPARTFRRELLGIDDDAPILMSGHQASWWHAGILAKWFALEGCRLMPGWTTARLAWVVVDQDDNDPALLEYPASGPVRGVWKLSHASAVQDVPTGAREALRSIAPAPSDGVTASVQRGLDAIARAMRPAGDAPLGLSPPLLRPPPLHAASLAMQVQRAQVELIAPLADAEHTPLSFPATRIATTTFFAEFLGAIARDPRGCVEAYNAAAGLFPHAGIRPLAIRTTDRASRIELPLWHVARGVPRRAVFADELESTDPRTLAPRALAMTAILRLVGCDLFVHGLGGGAYDTVTDAWLRAWLPRCGPTFATLQPAPTSVVSATRYVAMPTAMPIVSPEEIARAHWRAHRAGHDPGLIEPGSLRAGRQRELVAAIRQAPRRSRERQALFHELHDLLREARATHEEELRALRDAAAAADASRALAGIIFDRTWAFALHDSQTLTQLRDDVLAAIRRQA